MSNEFTDSSFDEIDPELRNQRENAFCFPRVRCSEMIALLLTVSLSLLLTLPTALLACQAHPARESMSTRIPYSRFAFAPPLLQPSATGLAACSQQTIAWAGNCARGWNLHAGIYLGPHPARASALHATKKRGGSGGREAGARGGRGTRGGKGREDEDDADEEISTFVSCPSCSADT